MSYPATRAMSYPKDLASLMRSTGVKFGTSGARGLATSLTDELCYALTRAFVQYLHSVGEIDLKAQKGAIALGGDLRPSTDRILSAVFRAVRDAGLRPVFCGKVPSPALALYGFQHRLPTVMVTGSHIPEDRNGLKFTRARGEILKEDEQGIGAQQVELPDLFDDQGALHESERPRLPAPEPEARDLYLGRWLELFPPDLLEGRSIGVYGHSAVGRDLLAEILERLGAKVVRLGWTEQFVAIDTEALAAEQLEQMRAWVFGQSLFALVSTDGDGDRPLVVDDQGRWIRGDLLGILVAKHLDADTVVVPVTCNTALESILEEPPRDRGRPVRRVVRTRIGSPYVIAAMQGAIQAGGARVVGYEANGGFLTATEVPLGGGVLGPLPTRDALIVILCVLAQAVKDNLPVSTLVNQLPKRRTWSGRLGDFSSELSQQHLSRLIEGGRAAIEKELGQWFGQVTGVDTTDGLRITWNNEEILHLRASGNAPELRCYAEADSEERAQKMVERALSLLEGWRQPQS